MAEFLPLTNLIINPEEGILRTQVKGQWHLSEDLSLLYRALSPDNKFGQSRFVAYIRTAKLQARGDDAASSRDVQIGSTIIPGRTTLKEFHPRLTEHT
jgi:hypothetical protein